MKLIIEEDEIKLNEIVPSGLEGKIVDEGKRGRKENGEGRDELGKELAAIDGALKTASQMTLAKIHGVSQTEVSFLSRGYDRSDVANRKVNDDRKTELDQIKHNIADKATAKLMSTLELFDPDRVENDKLPLMADKLASIADRMSPRTEQIMGNGNTFVVFAPRTRREEEYQIIEVYE